MMRSPKIIWEKDKKEVELLKKQLHDLLKNNPKLIKKAAKILEVWLNERPKP